MPTSAPSALCDRKSACSSALAFPKQYAELVARTRVTAGFLLAAVYLWLARPTPASLAIGGAVALLGLGVRAWAAGHLEKNQRLAASGPYAHTRNPLYLGSLTTGLGFAIAGGRFWLGLAILVFFVVYYLPVVEEEERHLRSILPGYGEYERRVPRMAPSLRPRMRPTHRFRWSLYRKNREYQALLGYLGVMGLLALKIWRAFR